MKKIINPWAGLAGLGYNCFGCAPGNPFGLRMEFYEDGDDIVSFWNCGDNYQGWLKTLHGGIQASLMDEIAAWVIARKLQTTGMTVNLDIRYRKPIPTGAGVHVEVRGHLRETKRNLAFVSASILYNGELCSEADLTYFCVSKEKAAAEFYFSGCVTEE